jgi:hypothetical protein
MMQSLRNRTLTAPALERLFEARYNSPINDATVRRRLTEHELVPRIPARGLLLTADHRRNRLEFARNHVNRLIADWRWVLFSDKSRFCLYSSDRRVRVHRRPGERYSQCNITPDIKKIAAR